MESSLTFQAFRRSLSLENKHFVQIVLRLDLEGPQN